VWKFVDAGRDVFADVFFWFFDDAADVSVFDKYDAIFVRMRLFFYQE